MLEPGRILQDKYTIEATLGTGGMGAVYLGRMMRLGNKRVAIKEMAMGLANINEQAQAVQQFDREAQILAQLEHPGLVDVFDHFEEDGHHYLVMALVDGETLARILDTRRPGVAEVLGWADQLCAVLEYLHQHDPPIIFRDLKPANIMLDKHGHIRLIDFGIARIFEPSTATATFIRGTGTMGYSPIEQFASGCTDPRSDIYALGCTLYKLLTNQVPPPSPLLVCGEAILVPASTLNPDLTPALEAVLTRMMAMKRDLRYPSVADAREALRRVLMEPTLETSNPVSSGSQTDSTQVLAEPSEPSDGARSSERGPGLPADDRTRPVRAELTRRDPLPATERVPEAGASCDGDEGASHRKDGARRGGLPVPALPRRRRSWVQIAALLVVLGTLSGTAFWKIDHHPEPSPSPSASSSTSPEGAEISFSAVSEPMELATSKDGHLVAVLDALGDHDEAVVWDRSTGQQTTFSTGQPMESVALSPDGSLLATLEPFPLSTLVLWNVKTRASTPLAMYKDDTQHDAPPAHLAFSADGTRLTTGGPAQRIWSIKSGHMIHEFERWGELALSPDGTRSLSSDTRNGLVHCTVLATGQDVGLLYLVANTKLMVPAYLGWLPGDRAWFTTAGPVPKTAPGPSTAPASPDLTLQGPVLYCRSLASGEPVNVTLPGAVGVVRPAVSQDGRLLACGIYQQTASDPARKGTVVVWDTESWEVRCTLEAGPRVGAVAFLPDDHLLVSTYDDKRHKVTVAMRTLPP